MPGGGKGPAQLTAMAISQLRNAFIYAYNQKEYTTAGFYVTAMASALPRTAELKMTDMPTHFDKAGQATSQDTLKNFSALKVKPWIDEYYPKVEHALSLYIDNFYRNNPKLMSLY